MPRRAAGAPDVIDTSIDSVVDRLHRRRWPLLVSPIFVIVGMAYYFRWGSLFHHDPSEWISPGDLWDTLRAATSLVQGHVGSIYSAQSGFFAPPAFLILLAPLGALRNQFGTSFVEIRNNGHLVAHPLSYQASGGGPYFTTSTATLGTKTLAVHPQLFVILALYVLLLSCVALFACDALAERLGVSGVRRVVLSITEAVLLWNVAVIWGHPQDAIAVALVVYAVIFALDDRYKGAGWLLGASLAFQPLTIVVFPIVLVMGGRSRALGTAIRGVVPTVALVIAPLVASFHATYRSIVVQPAFPDTAYNHRTPWTSLAPSLGGRGPKTAIGGGPLRIAVLALAAGVGWLALRWRDRPEMIIWAVAVALALRCYLESAMTPYYVWPALAVGVVVAARGTWQRFAAAAAIAITVTILAQAHLGVYPWWLVDVGGLTALLVVASKPEPAPALESASETRSVRSSQPATRSKSPNSKSTNSKKKRKAARTDRKRSARR
jgi:hypothetical protein